MSSGIGDPIIPDDPWGPIKQDRNRKTAPPQEVGAFHSRDDVDASALAHHHTLGFGHNQASPGDHTHNGEGSKKIGTGLELTISGAKGGNAAIASIITMLHNVIDFTDNTTA